VKRAENDTRAAAETLRDEVASLLARMTREEKAGMLAGHDFWHLPGVQRLGIAPDVRCTDCGHGVSPLGEGLRQGTCFPTGVGQAATWNPRLIERLGAVLGQETLALGNSILLGPKISLHRIPVGGRNFETFSEDPFLAGKLAAAAIRGIQAQGAGACVKAATANNQQLNQSNLDVRLDERTLREIYTEHFRIALAEGRPWALMTSYNKLNGHYASANAHLIRDIIKDEWGFDGVVLSDWRGVHGPESLAAGLDLEMPGPGVHMTREKVLEALQRGTLTAAELDDRVRRLLTLMLRCRPARGRAARGPDTPAHGALARRVAEESLVLLKNDGALLPLDAARIRSLALIGPHATRARLGGVGSANLTPPYDISPLDGLRRRLGRRGTVRFAEGEPVLGSRHLLSAPHLEHDGPSGTIPGLKAEYFANPEFAGEPCFVGVHTSVDFAWGWSGPAYGMSGGKHSLRWTGRIRATATGRHTIGVAAPGGRFRLWIGDRLAAEGEAAPVNPQPVGAPTLGPLDDPTPRCVFPVAEGHVELFLCEGQCVDVRLEYVKTRHPGAIRLEWTPPGAGDPMAEAAAVAAGCDAAIVCAGLCSLHEGGGLDRAGIALPGRQAELIRAVARANPRTVVVLYGGNPLEMRSWSAHVPAIVQAWYPGQEGGHALARVLFGDINPSGRLPVTIPVRAADHAAWKNYPGEHDTVRYAEGVFIGYRHFDRAGIEPMYPFGFGLSYTRFAYRKLRISARRIRRGDSLRAEIVVKNTGRRAGQEVVQLYVRDVEASVPRPPWELRGFAKIALQPGESRTVSFEIGPRDLAFYDAAAQCWRIEPGRFEVRIGPHSRAGLVTSFEVVL